MKQIIVISEFIDITCSNCRRKVGDMFIVSDERAVNLVNGNLCEYVVDKATDTKVVEIPAELKGGKRSATTKVKD